MDLRPLAIALLLTASAAQAQDSCGLRVARLLASGDTSTVLSFFKASDRGTRKQLAAITARCGKLTHLAEASMPRFKAFTRYSVPAAGLPETYGFRRFLVDAASPRLGPVQLLIAVDPGAECEVLAIHLDVDSTIQVASAVSPALLP
jgi:hypothetical protein